MFDFASLAFSLQSSLTSGGIPFRRSHAYEVLAAAVGYNSYAALKTSGFDAQGNMLLSQANHVVLQPELVFKRATQLGLDEPQAAHCETLVIDQMVKNPHAGTTRIWRSTEDFRDGYLHEHIGETAADSDEASAVMAETNAYVDSVYVEEVEEWGSQLDESDEWIVLGSGQIDMDQDPERPFHGDKVLFTVRLVYDKVDRVGLIQSAADVSAELDASWREDNLE